MMRASRLVFDRYVPNGGTQYTGAGHMRRLAEGYRIGFTAVAYGAIASPVELVIDMQHSAGGEAFKFKTRLFAGVITTANRVIVGGETGTPRPRLKYVRLAVTGAGTTIERLRIFVTVRGSAEEVEGDDDDDGKPKDETDGLLIGPPGSHLRTAAMTRELQELVAQAQALPEAQRLQHVLSNLSSSTQEHLRELDRRLDAAPAALREGIIQAAASVARIARSAGGGGA